MFVKLTKSGPRRYLQLVESRPEVYSSLRVELVALAAAMYLAIRYSSLSYLPLQSHSTMCFVVSPSNRVFACFIPGVREPPFAYDVNLNQQVVDGDYKSLRRFIYLLYIAFDEIICNAR